MFIFYKRRHAFGFIQIFSIFTHFCKKHAEKSNFLASLQPRKYLKYFLPKEPLLDTTIWLISILFIKIGLLCWWYLCYSISVSSNFIIFQTIFIYTFNFSYNFLFLLFKSAFCSNFTASKVLPQKTSWYLTLICSSWKYFY